MNWLQRKKFISMAGLAAEDESNLKPLPSPKMTKQGLCYVILIDSQL